MIPVVLAGWLLLPGVGHAQADPDIASLVEGISPDSLRASVTRLAAFQTRYAGSDSNEAAAVWIRNRLADLGYRDARFDTFTVNVDRVLLGHHFLLAGRRVVNVVARKRGVLWPERTVVLGAHYDSISLSFPDSARSPETLEAPGANDNATGVAAVLEMARLLRPVDTDLSVVFALFNAEELGLWGSADYAARARARGDDIRAMFGIDALGTRDSAYPAAFTIDAASRSLSLAMGVARSAEAYTGLAPRNTAGTGPFELISRFGREGCGCSDHQSFLDQGYPAVGVFQYIGAEAVYHSARDTVGLVDFSLVSGIGRAALAAALGVAGYPGRTPDFDRDGQVAIHDFFLFAEGFGAARGQVAYDPRFDLDRDGVLGIEDFFLFADRFGQKLQ